MQLPVTRGDRFDMIGDKVCAAASAIHFLGNSVLSSLAPRFRRRGHFGVRSHFQGLVIDVVQHPPATPKTAFSGDTGWQDTV